MATGGGTFIPSLSETGAQMLALMGSQVKPLSNQHDSASEYYSISKLNLFWCVIIFYKHRYNNILYFSDNNTNDETILNIQENVTLKCPEEQSYPEEPHYPKEPCKFFFHSYIIG